MNNWFANISVTLKLGIGFALVLAMTVVLAMASWSGLGSLIQRSDWMGEISRLSTALTELRISRLQYMLANGDEQAGERVDRALAEYSARHQQVLPVVRSPENIERLQQQAVQIKAYGVSFDAMRVAYRAAAEARQAMVQDATEAGRIIDEIAATVSSQSAYEDGLAARFEAITKAKDDWQRVRYHMLGYVNDPNAQTERLVMGEIDATVSALAAFREVFGLLQPQRVAQIESALGSYRDAALAFKRANDAVVSTRAEMTHEVAEINRLNQELLDNQYASRDAESASARTLLFTTTFLALLFGVLAAWVITRQITRPLSSTLAVVELIASGDLREMQVTTRRDEIGVLQQGVQRMGNTLRELISGIRDSVSQIASAAEELSAVTEQTSAGVNSQKQETDQVATAMQEMSATVQEVARNAEQASRAAADADHEAHQGDQVVAEAIQQIDHLAQEMARSTEAMSALQQESDRIGSVMDVIKAVADQTNLLALNAAIEAARAGEAGRGFAVVADEVRSLARRTQQSTEEIESLIAGLQRGTQQVAGVLQESRSLTEGSVALARKAGESLATINQKVSNIQSMNQQIAAAAEQQGAVAEEIGRSVLNVRDVAEQSATASDETAASSAELARLGNQLQSMVSRFRV